MFGLAGTPVITKPAINIALNGDVVLLRFALRSKSMNNNITLYCDFFEKSVNRRLLSGFNFSMIFGIFLIRQAFRLEKIFFFSEIKNLENPHE